MADVSEFLGGRAQVRQGDAAGGSDVGLGFLAVAIVGVMAGLIAAVAAGVLAETYRPHAPGVETFLLPARVRDADRWADVHQVAVVVLSLISLVTAVVVVAEKLRSTAWLRRHVGVAIAAAGAALIAVVHDGPRPVGPGGAAGGDGRRRHRWLLAGSLR